MLDRQSFLTLLGSAVAVRSSDTPFSTADRIARGGLAIVVVDRAGGRRWQLRPQRRFRLCEAIALPLAVFVWDAVDRGRLERGSAISIEPSDVRDGSGSTEPRSAVPPLVLVGRALRELDTTATDVLLKTVGGMKTVAAWLDDRGLDIRADRTASPAAMAELLDQLTAGVLVGPEATASIMAEMESAQIEGNGVRSKLPANWISGGSACSDDRSTNDVGFVIPAGRRKAICLAGFVETPPALPGAARSALSAARKAVLERVADAVVAG